MTQQSGASFRVDMEQAPEAIKELQSALDQLEDIRRTAGFLGRVEPGSGDSVSVDAAALIGRAAVGGPGSLVSALDAGIQQVQQLIYIMTAELNEYRQREAATTENFNGAAT